MEKKSIKKRALANEIADAIQLGEYRSGEWLRQIDLEEKFGATRFDIRTALEELVVRKAIQHVPNRGYRVMVLDEQTFTAIREVRVILECAAARIVAIRADPATLQRLRQLAELFSEAIERGTTSDQSRTNREFHRLFYNACGNPVLEETIWALRDRSRATPLTTWQSQEALSRANEDHRQMLAAIENKAPDLLAEIVARHIKRSHDLTEVPGTPAAVQTSRGSGISSSIYRNP